MAKNRARSRNVICGVWGDRYIDKLLESGTYNTVSEIIREALRIHFWQVKKMGADLSELE